MDTSPGLLGAGRSEARDPLRRVQWDLSPACGDLLHKLMELRLISPTSAGVFLEQSANLAREYDSVEKLGGALVQTGYLTRYQLDRVLAGTTHGLVLGNYAILERLGAGAMCVVFLAEHVFLKRRVAIKVFPVADDCPEVLLERFYGEMRVLADLHHPNIVMAFDAGRLPPAGPGMSDILYLVLELVSGGDLEQHVMDHGPVPVPQACSWVCQAACGLQEAHDQHLIHRDVKPSNMLLSSQGQVKVVDFGLAHQFCSSLTDPQAILGTLEFMAPEQSRDPSAVGIQADIYGLGATLFWLLTGDFPYPPTRMVSEALRMLQRDRPRRLRSLRPDVPAELDELLDRMLDPDPARRLAMPVSVMNAMLPFTLATVQVAVHSADGAFLAPADGGEGNPACIPGAAGTNAGPAQPRRRVLVVDDEPGCRRFCRCVVEWQGCRCDEAPDATQALAAVAREKYDLVLLDLNLPDMDGYEVCRRLRERASWLHTKVIVVSGRGDHNSLAEVLAIGADDYIAKPFGRQQLEAKVKHALRLKEAQEQADSLARQLVQTNRQLESSLVARSQDVRLAQDALLFGMTKMVESRDDEDSGHFHRLRHYVRCLAEQAREDPNWAEIVDRNFLEQLDRCVPLHDIGKIGVPERILHKPGRLDAEERAVMETHALVGTSILESLAREHGESLEFLNVARAIVRHHHERFDGRGYPDGLGGLAIPPAARLVTLADVYDALRRKRFHKPALSHAEAARVILEHSPGQFDPALLRSFAACAHQFRQVYETVLM